jgi:hypothetical protein
MPIASRVMILFGAVLLVGGAVGWFVRDGTLRAGFGMGLAMIAAGAAAAQGRTSLRRTGYFVGAILPVLAAALFGWRAVDHWKTLGGAAPRPFPAVMLTLTSAAGLITVIILMKLRAGDAVAERGYSVLPMQSHAAPAPQPAPENQPADRT